MPGFGKSNTEAPLAAMLYAASPRGNGKGIEWVLLAVDNLEEDKKDPDAPGWHSAARYVAGQPCCATRCYAPWPWTRVNATASP